MLVTLLCLVSMPIVLLLRKPRAWAGRRSGSELTGAANPWSPQWAGVWAYVFEHCRHAVFLELKTLLESFGITRFYTALFLQSDSDA